MIRKSKINEDDLVNVVKKEIITRLTDRLRYDSIEDKGWKMIL